MKWSATVLAEGGSYRRIQGAAGFFEADSNFAPTTHMLALLLFRPLGTVILRFCSGRLGGGHNFADRRLDFVFPVAHNLVLTFVMVAKPTSATHIGRISLFPPF
jgi:hypothetical protein